jgi:hypothetical protein
MSCYEHECPDCVQCITQRVAVDIPGEDERIRRRLHQVEHVFGLLVHEVNRRAAREGRALVEQQYVTDSPRLTALQLACDSLERAAGQLTEALLSSGTMTDEPPF